MLLPSLNKLIHLSITGFEPVAVEEVGTRNFTLDFKTFLNTTKWYFNQAT